MTEVQGKPSIVAAKALLKGDPEGLRELVRAVLQEALEAEMSDALGAAKSERTTGRLGYRSGYYGRTLVTRVGKLELRVPQDREGRFSTELFERYQRSEQALVASLAPGAYSAIVSGNCGSSRRRGSNIRRRMKRFESRCSGRCWRWSRQRTS